MNLPGLNGLKVNGLRHASIWLPWVLLSLVYRNYASDILGFFLDSSWQFFYPFESIFEEGLWFSFSLVGLALTVGSPAAFAKAISVFLYKGTLFKPLAITGYVAMLIGSFFKRSGLDLF